MYIDLGVSSAKVCPVETGDVAVFERTLEDLGDRLVSKAMDDRVGVAILIKMLQEMGDSPNNVYAVFTVQEEDRGTRRRPGRPLGSTPTWHWRLM